MYDYICTNAICIVSIERNPIWRLHSKIKWIIYQCCSLWIDGETWLNTRKDCTRIPVRAAYDLSHVSPHVCQFVPRLAWLPSRLLHHQISPLRVRPSFHSVGIIHDARWRHDCWKPEWVRSDSELDTMHNDGWMILYIRYIVMMKLFAISFIVFYLKK